jgi:hypothetical protein
MKKPKERSNMLSINHNHENIQLKVWESSRAACSSNLSSQACTNSEETDASELTILPIQTQPI